MSSSTPDTPADTTKPAPAKKKSKLLLIIAVVCAVALGCGGFFMYRTFAATPAKAEKNKKKRTARDEEKEASAEESEEESKDGKNKKEEGDHEEGSPEKSESGDADVLAKSLPDDEEVKHIVTLEPFIVNLADEGDPRYLRISVNLGTGEGEGGEEGKPDPLFMARVRNSMLSVLMTKRSSEILTVEGKTALRKELLRAAQAASEEPHVEAVYITDFIVQL